MKWEEVCENKQLQDLPFKIELNKWGQIIMSPAKPNHSAYKGIIISLLSSLIKTGVAMPECAIQTTDGVKVADVVWASDPRADIILEETAASIAPEICLEVKSANNSLEEMLEKKDLYFAAGAEEVWFCDAEGKMRFYDRQQELSKSSLVPEFPEQIRRRNQHTV